MKYDKKIKKIIQELKSHDIQFNKLSYHRLKDKSYEALESGDEKLSHKIDIAADLKEILSDDEYDEDIVETLTELYLAV